MFKVSWNYKLSKLLNSINMKSITEWNLIECVFFLFFFFMKAFHILRFWYFKMNQYLLICIQYIDIDNLLTSYPAKWNKYFIIIFRRKFWILNRRKEQRRRLNRTETRNLSFSSYHLNNVNQYIYQLIVSLTFRTFSFDQDQSTIPLSKLRRHTSYGYES